MVRFYGKINNMWRALPSITGRFVDFTTSNHNYPMPACIHRTFVEVFQTNRRALPFTLLVCAQILRGSELMYLTRRYIKQIIVA
jgi:hypothetical protein